MSCPFCNTDLLWEGDEVAHAADHCLLISSHSQTLKGCMYIVPKKHRLSPFELSDDEFLETRSLMLRAKGMMDESLSCDGFNIGWNVGEVGGQSLDHVHLHVVPRYSDEKFAGREIRHWFKLDENLRSSC